MSINSCCSWFVLCLVKIIGKVNIFKHIFMCILMRSVYNESLICDCDGAEILRPQHFFVVCELTSIHDNILSRVELGRGLAEFHDSDATFH